MADDAAVARTAPPVHSYAPGSWGPEGGSKLAGIRALARAVDRERGAACAAQSAPHRRRSLRSPATRSSRTATPARSWPPTARSTGSACPPSTRRACSAACSTARRGSSGSVRGSSPPLLAQLSSRGPTCSRRRGRRRPAGSCVSDTLTIGPREHEDTVTPPPRPPADDDGDHMLVRTVECINGQVDVELVCEPAFDYGRAPAEWALVGDDRHAADATGAGQTISVSARTSASASRATASADGTRSGPETAPTAPSPGRRGSPGPGTWTRRTRGWPRRPTSGGPGSPGAHPRSPFPRPDPALRSGDQGSDVHAGATVAA